MAGSREGGLKAAATNKARHGEDFYKRAGALGGGTPTDKPKGFATMSKEQISEAGKKGGHRSRLPADPERRKEQSKRMKRMWELLKQDEQPTP